MTALELIQQLESGTPHPVYFLYGEEDFFQRELIAKVTRRWITPDNRPYFSLTKSEVTSKTGESTKSYVTLNHGLGKKMVYKKLLIGGSRISRTQPPPALDAVWLRPRLCGAE